MKSSKNKLVKETYEKALQADFTKLSGDDADIANFAQMEHFYSKYQETEAYLDMWQSGGGLSENVFVRGAINELKGEADEKINAEAGFFLYQKEVMPYKFFKAYKEGRENSIGLIPYIVKTQQHLREKYPEGYVTIYRGIRNKDLAYKMRMLAESLSEDDVMPMPHDGVSGYSISKVIAKNFAGSHGSREGVVFSKRVPISDIWIDFTAFSDKFEDEGEVLVDSKAVEFFKKDEIEFN